MNRDGYPENKKVSGGWFSSSPSHWDFDNCRAIVQNISIKNDDGLEQNYLSLMANIGVIPYEEKGDIGNKKPEDLSKCKVVKRGNLVINSMNYAIGSYGMSPYDGVCSPVYIVLNPIERKVLPRFALRVFENKAFQSYAASFGNGILEHRAAISWDDIKKIKIAIPPINEQQEILSYLDRETAKIDGLIQKQEELIELLLSKRTSTIDECLLRGINRNETLMESGNDLIGKIPKRWSFKRLKYSMSINPSYRELGAVEGDLMTPFFAMESIGVDGTLDVTVTRKFSDVASSYTYFKNGDVVVAKVTPCFENFKGALIQNLSIGFGFGTTELVVLRPNLDVVSGEYLYLISISPTVREMGASLMTGAGGLKRVPDQFFLNLRWPLPDVNEQKMIVGRIKEEVQKIDELIVNSNKSIELLKEHRSSLISAAVTGKIKVAS